MSDEIVRGSESDRTTDPRESRVPRPPSPTACVPCAVGGGARGGRWRAVRVLSFVCSIHVRSRARPRARWKENLTTRSAKAFSLRSAKALSKSQNTTSPRTRDADEAQTQSESASTAVRGRTWGARQPRARPSCTATRPAEHHRRGQDRTSLDPDESQPRLATQRADDLSGPAPATLTPLHKF